MKMKFLLGFLGLASVATLASCSGTSSGTSTSSTETPSATTGSSETSENTSETTPVVTTTSGDTSTTTTTTPFTGNATIYLAGDSTVQTYNDNQYIGGWGQYLDLFLDDNITVKNAAKGGRSSRSFINEGRLFDTKESGFNYSFTENDGKSIESQITENDYLFIQFGHNDDDTKDYTDTQYKYLRMVPVGTPDANGIYPTVAPNNKQSTSTNLPTDMASSVRTEIAKYGANYYAYDEAGTNGTFKGYLKEYVDFAREKGATPVLITPVTRVKWSGNTIVGAEGAHGANLEYVEAVRQLANEEDVLLIDLYAYTKKLLETATPTYANYLMALKPNSLTGTWPAGYDTTYGNTDLGYSGIEGTHYNKYGAYLTAAKVAEEIMTNTETHKDGTEKFEFANCVNDKPSTYIAPSNLMSKATIAAVEETIEKINVTDPNRTFPTVTALEAKLAEIPAVDNITADNYKDVEVLVNEAKNLYAQLNVDDRKAEYKTTIDAADAKVKQIYIDLRPKATSSVEVDCSTLTAVSNLPADFVVDDPEAKLSISGGCLKLGGSGSATKAPNIAYTFSGTGKVIFTISASSGNTAKACMLGVSDGTNEVLANITDGAATDFTFEFEINGSTTFYMYRASGSGTGVMVANILIEYFAAE